jgi:hypothetical protein
MHEDSRRNQISISFEFSVSHPDPFRDQFILFTCSMLMFLLGHCILIHTLRAIVHLHSFALFCHSDPEAWAQSSQLTFSGFRIRQGSRDRSVRIVVQVGIRVKLPTTSDYLVPNTRKACSPASTQHLKISLFFLSILITYSTRTQAYPRC